MSPSATTTRYCTLQVADRLVGIGVERVLSVLRPQSLRPVPLAPPGLAGVLVRRGEVLPAIDLRRQLGLPAAPEQRQYIMVVQVEGGPVGLLVDRAGEVLTVEGPVEPLPTHLTGPAARRFSGTIRLPDGRLLHLLDPDEAILVEGPGPPPHPAPKLD